MERNLQNCKEREGSLTQDQKNDNAVKVLKLEQMQKMKHFSITVLLGRNVIFL